MCPSYMVTRDEEHSTRGRAHLLAEMMRGDGLTGEWRNKEVKESLDLCLSCKGCKSDCPVSVDIATYKAEFLSHYYRRRLRPRAAYSMGLIHWWARAGSHLPRVVNRLASTPVLAAPIKSTAGIAPSRRIPALAPFTFTSWFRQRSPGDRAKTRCVVWPDTFTNHFAPWVGIAAVSVLDSLGFRPIVPEASLCCGRPLYDFGMLSLAQHHLRRILRALAPAIRAGTPVVVLEPSCLAVFRDEMHNLLPDDDGARRLASQAVSLGELLASSGSVARLPALHRTALVQVHCHQHAVVGVRHERAILDALSLDWRELDAGCCGMAGSFGFERGRKHAISVAAGERILLPAVRAADPSTLIVADGFSCREQIAQGAGRRAHHLAEVIATAMGC